MRGRPAAQIATLVHLATITLLIGGCNGDLVRLFGGKETIGCCVSLSGATNAHWSTQSQCSDASQHWFTVATDAATQEYLKECRASGPPPSSSLSPSVFAPEARIMLSAFLPTQSTQGFSSCLKTCSAGINDSKCTVANLNATINHPLEKLLVRVSAGDDLVITPATLMSDFSQQKDPCERGVTRVNANGVTNVGKLACVLRARFANSTQELQLEVPQTLSGVWSSRASPLSLQFPDLNRAPKLRFAVANTSETQNSRSKQAADLMNQDFGGVARQVEYDGSRLFVQTTNGACVGVTVVK